MSSSGINSLMSAMRPGPMRMAAAVMVALALSLWLAIVPDGAADPDRPSSSNCFGGVFSANPLHCRVLTWAHDQEVITAEAIYSAGGAIFIYVTEPQSAMEGIFARLEARGRTEIAAATEDLCQDDYAGCAPGVLPDHFGFTLLPPAEGIKDILLRPGGAEARKQDYGWAHYRQIWPSTGAATRNSAGGSFDVSDVSTTDIPAVDCQSLRFFPETCWRWQDFPDLDIAGWVIGGTTTVYVQVKAAPGEESAKVEAAKAFLKSEFPDFTDQNLVVTAVKYDFGQYWRWQEILNKFMFSAANTTGITGAEIATNDASSAHSTRIDYPAQGPGFADAYEDTIRARTTLWVWTLDAEATLAGLPLLLPQLGIPVDAVGVVIEQELTPWPNVYIEASIESLPGADVNQGESIKSLPGPSVDKGEGIESLPEAVSSLPTDEVTAGSPDGLDRQNSVQDPLQSNDTFVIIALAAALGGGVVLLGLLARRLYRR